MKLQPGQTLQNRYRIVSLLGQGGMGAVYRAWHVQLDVPVALKEMVPQPGLDPQTLAQLRKQFRQEAKILARLKHPHLVGVSDYFEEGGKVYLVMEFVEGESLADHIARHGALPEAQVSAWGRQLLDALGYCHAQGIVHRDIKPQNVILTPTGEAILVDFGLVKLWNPHDPRTHTVMRGMGTPEYAPPEQWGLRPGHTDPRSDLYSLGATLYHALTGQAPLSATDRIADPERFLRPRTVIPTVSPAMETTILKALELSRADRWASAAEMKEGLKAHPSPPSPLRQRTGRSAPREEPPKRKRRKFPNWAWIAGAIAFLILLGIGCLSAIGVLVDYDSPSLTPEGGTEAGAPPATAESPSAARVAISPANATSLEEVTRAGKGSATSLAYSPRGDRLAVGTWSGIYLYDEGSREVSHFNYDRLIRELTFSADGSRLAALASSDGESEVQIWDLDQEELVTSHKPYWTDDLAFSPDGTLLAYGSSEGAVVLLDAQSGTVTARLEEHTDYVECVALSPDGTRLASGSRDDSVSVWTADGEWLYAINVASNVMDLAFSPDGELLAVAYGDTVEIRTVSNGALNRTLEDAADTENLAFSPDGALLAGGGRGNLVLWRLSDGTRIAYEGLSSYWATEVAFSPDGDTLATVIPERRIQLWDVEGCQNGGGEGCIRPTPGPEGHWGAIWHLDFDPSGDRLAAGNGSGEVHLVDISGKLQTTLTHDDPITSVDFSPEGERLVTANFVLSFLDFSDTEQMRTLHLWDVTRTPPQRLQLLDDAEPWSATYAPHGDTLAAVAFDRPVRLWDVSGCDAAGGAGECASLVRELSEVQAPNTRPAFSIDGEQLAVGGESGQVYVWSTSDGSLLHSLDAHNGGVVALAFSPDGSLLASAGMEEDYDSALYLWRLSDGSLQRALSEHETYVASTLDFSPDGSLLVSADQEGLRMWDVAGGELTKKIDHLGNPVSFAFSPDGTLLASGGEGGIVHIWGVSRP